MVNFNRYSLLALALALGASPGASAQTPLAVLDDVRDVALSPDGDRLYALHSLGDVRQFDSQNGQLLRSVTTGIPDAALTLSPRGTQLAVSSEESELAVIETRSFSLSLATDRAPGSSYSEFHWQDEFHFARGYEGIWSTAELRTREGISGLESLFATKPRPRPFATETKLHSPNHPMGLIAYDWGYVSARLEDGVGIIRRDLTNGLVRTFVGRSSFVDAVTHIAISAGGSRVTAVTGGMQMGVWDDATGKLLFWQGRGNRRAEAVANSQGAMAVLETSPTLLIASSRGELQAIDMTSGATLFSVRLHDQGIEKIHVSRDEQRLVTVGGGIAKLWDLLSLSPRQAAPSANFGVPPAAAAAIPAAYDEVSPVSLFGI